MQTLRDAILLLVVILIFTTVRISPAPEVHLSAAQAAVSAQAASQQPEVELGNATAAAPGGDAEHAEQPSAGSHCPESLAVKSQPRVCPKQPVNPCDA